MVAAAVCVSLWAGVRLSTWLGKLSRVLCFWETVAVGVQGAQEASHGARARDTVAEFLQHGAIIAGVVG